jgi:hypothetical protein
LKEAMQRSQIFLVEVTFLIILLASGLLFFLAPAWFTFIPLTLGPIPVGAPWYGALGAVLVSLAGVFAHEKDWDPEYWQWHLARPLIGASLAIISVLIFKAGILAVGSSTTPSGSAPTNLLYYLIAFLVGYREETFRELIKRLTDVILTPGSPPAKPATTITAIKPPTAPFGTPTPVIVTGTGLSKATHLIFGTTSVDIKDYKIDSDIQITVTTPAMAAPADVKLTIVTDGGSAQSPFKFT